MRTVMLAAALATAAVATAAGAATSYTQAQAAAGSAVYAGRCSSCHGVHLGGGAGPGLLGPSITKGYTPQSLHDFIKTQMPANAPGTLSAAQYDDVTAFLLAKNGRLGAQPAAAAKAAPSGLSAEIVRSAPPPTTARTGSSTAARTTTRATRRSRRSTARTSPA